MPVEYGSQWGFYTVVWQMLHHVTALFPEDTDLTCTLTAAEAAHTWGTWAEIVDNEATTLSACFDTYPGHIVAMLIESVSETDTIYMLEVSYGSAKIIVTRWRFAGGTKFQSPAHQLRVRSANIPAGETVYYRMKSGTGVADTALVHFRHFLHT